MLGVLRCNHRDPNVLFRRGATSKGQSSALWMYSPEQARLFGVIFVNVSSRRDSPASLTASYGVARLISRNVPRHSSPSLIATYSLILHTISFLTF